MWAFFSTEAREEHRELPGRPPGLGLVNQGRGLPPDVGWAVGGLVQPACDVVVTQRPVQPPRQARGRTRRAQQIIRVRVWCASHHKAPKRTN